MTGNRIARVIRAALALLVAGGGAWALPVAAGTVGGARTVSVGAAMTITVGSQNSSYNPESLSRTLAGQGTAAGAGGDVAVESLEIAHERFEPD